MARAPREHLLCPSCDWRGRTTLSHVRLWVFRATTAVIVVLIALELVGVTALEGDLWAIVLILGWGSVGVRLLIRGDRCPSCGERAIYVKRPPPVADSSGPGLADPGPGVEPPQGDPERE